MHIHKVHDDSQVYECDLCHQKFQNRNLLSAHKSNTHKESNYVIGFCNHCNKTFDTQIKYKKHQQAYHSGPRQCHLCKEFFKNKRAKDYHMTKCKLKY